MSVAAPAMPGPAPRARLSPIKIIVFVELGLIVLLGFAFALIKLQEPPAPEARCENPGECEPVTVADPLIHGKLFEGELGHQFNHSDDFWAVIEEGPNNIQLQEQGGAPLWILIEAVPTSEQEPEAFLDAQLDDLEAAVSELGEVTDPELIITNPQVGSQHGVGGLFAGTLSAQGQSVPVAVAAMAASRDDITVGVIVVAGQEIYEPAAQLADSVLNTFLYPSQIDG